MRARLRALAASASLASSCLCACGAADPPNVVMILIDTLRADHLGCYGYARPISPNIDALAGEGTLFENAVAQSSWTGPSVASLFTSVYPSQHGMTQFGSTLATGRPTLAEELRRGGYRTLAVSANFAFVNQRKGLLRGFDQIEELSRRADPGEKSELLGISAVAGRLVTDRAIELLDASREDPFFLYVHYMDPHSSYQPNPTLATSQPGYQGPVDGSTDQLQQIVRGEIEIGERDLAQLISLYDGEIASVDTEVGRLLDHLRDIGAYDASVIVLLSDHGEEFLDHGSLFHMFTLYREQIHVPLILRRPGGYAGGLRVRSVVELVDIGPTLLELAGLADPRPIVGASLVSVMDGSADARSGTEEKAAFSELHGDPQVTAVWRAKKHRTALTTQAWSLVAGEPRGAVELYDLAADPGQTRDRAAQQRPVLEALSQRLSAQATSVWDPQPEQRIDEQEALGLRALGYLD